MRRKVLELEGRLTDVKVSKRLLSTYCSLSLFFFFSLSLSLYIYIYSPDFSPPLSPITCMFIFVRILTHLCPLIVFKYIFTAESFIILQGEVSDELKQRIHRLEEELQTAQSSMKSKKERRGEKTEFKKGASPSRIFPYPRTALQTWGRDYPTWCVNTSSTGQVRRTQTTPPNSSMLSRSLPSVPR